MPVFFMADDWNLREQGTGSTLGLAAPHELTKVSPSCLGEFSQLLNDLWLLSRYIRGLGLV